MLDTLITILRIVIFLIGPCLYLVCGWVIDRCRRQKGATATQRWFVFATYSAALDVIVIASTRVPPQYQFSWGNATIVGISYTFGLGWLFTPFLAIGGFLLGVCCGTAAFLLT